MRDKHWPKTRPMAIAAAAWWAARLNLQAKTAPFIAEVVRRCHAQWLAQDLDKYAREKNCGWLFTLEWDYDAKEILGEALEAVGEKTFAGGSKVAAYTRFGPNEITFKDGYGAHHANLTSDGADKDADPMTEER